MSRPRIIIADTDTFDKSPLLSHFCIGRRMLKTHFPTHGGRASSPPQNMALDKLKLYIHTLLNAYNYIL